MIVPDYPYVSDFLKASVSALGIDVLDTAPARALLAGADVRFASRDELADRIARGEAVYTNSENSLEAVLDAAGDSALARRIELCKDKAAFREALAGLYPDFRFRRVPLEELESLDVTALPKPFVIKPARGFFSLGVHPVFADEEWPGVVKAIREETRTINQDYPEAVVDRAMFLAEEALQGEEYAIDAYFRADGQAVILNVYHHVFPSADDVSDRLYYTSETIIREKLPRFREAVQAIGKTLDFRDFCMHLEVREDASGNVVPIEANPLRFAGWCVADLSWFAWGFNPYEYYFRGMEPDWDAILKERGNMIYSMCIGDVPPGVDRNAIESVDYDGFADLFHSVLELRRIDHTAYPVFAFAFAATPESEMDELKKVLSADFSHYLRMK
ncbi:ATP-grasp domain-containing protein [Pseudodesulfovibrio tunisiensis]|uniref:ATP-grasp domain-containing protein n=1 Tax=Pseudodesulfovibrio tunisiensis TaxID=463192 RepID=UPI001FB4F16C|nr:ATP-grasp domain-containing protein [Pseudodesulfovibrio tunisiensis]